MKKKATTPEELKQFVHDNPYEFPSFFLADDSFAFYCYSNKAYMDLCEKLEKGQPEKEECERFQLTEDQWKTGMEMARLALLFEMESLTSE